MSTTGGTGTAAGTSASTTTPAGATSGTAGGTSTSTTTPNASTTTADATLVIPDPTEMTLTTDVYGMFVGAFFVILTVIVMLATGSIMSVLVLWAVIALILVVMVYYDFLTVDQLIGQQKKEVKKPEPTEQPVFRPSGGPMVGSEVFHVNDQIFTYDEAAAVCAAYDSELATLEQIMDAFANGADWCSYGWSAGAMALYPTQRETWDRLQGEIDHGKRTRCGRPGVNGGYFDPTLKFGVNCFGFKPRGKFTPPAPVPGMDGKEFSGMVNRFKELLKGFSLNPYSRMEWSEFDDTAVKMKETFTGGASSIFNLFKQDFVTPYGVREHLAGAQNEDYVEPINQSGLGQGASSLRGPYGLRGDIGDIGPTGSTGPKGDDGKEGPTGSQGIQGNEGVKGEVGATGPQGIPGQEGRATGVFGPTGPAGTNGGPGPTGAMGPTGKQGNEGKVGATGPKGDRGDRGDAATVPSDLNVNSLRIGSMSIVDTGGNLQIRNVNNPNPSRVINLWAAGNHSSMMTTHTDGSQIWFGYK